MFEKLFTGESIDSFWFGIISAVSLPIGAVVGIALKPGKKVVAAVMAFGAGSLLAALTLELVSPALEQEGAGYYPLAIGAVTGGAMFVLLNHILNGKGGFLRKPATIVRYLLRTKKERIHNIINKLSNVEILCALPTSEIASLVPNIAGVKVKAGQEVFMQGDKADALYLIDEGELEVIRDDAVIAVLKPGDSFGEMAILSGEPRNATIRAKVAAKLWCLLKSDFEQLKDKSPALVRALQSLSDKRCEENRNNSAWRDEVQREVDTMDIAVTDNDVVEASEGHGGAAFAIWLGIALDGIPESAVIGASIASSIGGHTAISWALIVGLFLSNFPEAMSSAVGMRRQKSSISKIMGMWISLMLLTGIGALLGNVYFQEASPFMFALFEGCAAGAMLVMISETMLPEAYQQGGSIVGMSTLFGFLTALFVKHLGA
ncbi:MAG: cyclic nucleotide-binding domain-containing protein [Planctomycetes bacterium]|nr:cyclic nucleotide-binding domain-containing protein [Planctomycetota bacterium]